MIISLIVAADEKNGIGKSNQLLCHLSADLKYFKQTTTGHHIVMGRKTYESVSKPLPNRTNIVISRTSNTIDGCVVKSNIEEAIAFARSNNENELFITGGGTVYDLTMHLADRIYLTKIHHIFEADTFFPHFDKHDWQELKNEFHKADEKISTIFLSSFIKENCDVVAEDRVWMLEYGNFLFDADRFRCN